jgi:hypothetical protein
MHRDTAIACWYRRIDPACFTDQSSVSMYADVGALAAPAFDDRARLWASPPAFVATWGDAPPIADSMPHPIVSALTSWFAALTATWRRPLASEHQSR